jgi:hypothetical protein
MGDWLSKSFQEFSILWLLFSSVVGGIIGASIKFVFDNLLPNKLTTKRELYLVKNKYSTPILLAADQLRKRLDNMIQYIDLVQEEKWLSSLDDYYTQSSLYTVSQFLGWEQILRHEVVYLDFSTSKDSRVYECFLRGILHGFSQPDYLNESRESDPYNSKDKWIYTFGLQVIGEAMINKENDNFHVKSFAEFNKDILDSADIKLKAWLKMLENMFMDLKKNDIRFKRVVAIHCFLNAFINYYDKQHIRTETQKFYWSYLLPDEKKKMQDKIKSIVPSISFVEK